MKYIFFGTPKFAAIVLEKLISTGYVPKAVICNPNEPIGRKHVLTLPPVKILAEKFNITVFQPEKLRGNSEFVDQLKKLKPDLAVVAAYGKIIPKEILEISKLGFINVHGSLLPAYRGASPIQHAILNGDKETGVTIMKIDEEMDHGPIISNVKIQISNDDTYESLSQKLAISGAKLLIKIIPDYINGKIKPIEQDHSKATYAKIIKKEDGRIDWSKSAGEIERMTRAFYPWPSAYANIKNKIIKIIEADVSENGDSHQSRLAVQCGKGILIIKKLQLEGGKILSAKEFLNGHKDFVNAVCLKS